MNIEITIKRGPILLTNYDPEFMSKLDAMMDDELEPGKLTDRGEGYMRMVNALRELRGAIETILPQETKEPFTITLKVD